MADPRRKTCKGCDRRASEVGELSWKGLCVECWNERREAGIVQMQAHKGPYFDKWRRSMAASVGGALLDDLPPVA